MKKILLTFILVVVAAVSGLFLSLTNSDVEDLIVCASDEGTHYIPGDLCRYYLYNFRGGEEDMEYLRNRGGLGFVFGITDKAIRRNLVQFLITKGLSVNGISKVDGLTPLQAAILLNDADLVRILISSGADIGRKAGNGLDSREFMARMEAKNPDVDRREIRQLISN